MSRDEIRVAVLIVTGTENVVDKAELEEIFQFCEADGVLPVVYLREETASGSLSRRGYEAVSQLVDKDMIDGVLTLSGMMLDGEYGNALKEDAERKGFFIAAYEDIVKSCKEEDFLAVIIM